MRKSLLATSCETNGCYMVFSEGVQVAAVDYLVCCCIGEVGIVFCETKRGFIYYVCWVVYEVKGFFCGLFGLGFCCHNEVRNAGYLDWRFDCMTFVSCSYNSFSYVVKQRGSTLGTQKEKEQE